MKKLLFYLIIIIGIGVLGYLTYEKIRSIDMFNFYSQTLTNLESDKERLNSEIASLRHDLGEANRRIEQYRDIEQRLRERNRELEESITNLSGITEGIGNSQSRAVDYNKEARTIIEDIRRGLESDN
jgi:chromosome segregation ATPase